MKKTTTAPAFLFAVLLACLARPAAAQFSNYEFADTTQILLVFENEQDTAAINALKREWQATEIGTTPLTRIHLWQIPPDTVAAYGGPIGIQNHAIGKAVIKGESLNFSVPAILNVDDDDDDENDPENPPCYPDSIFVCQAGPHAVNVAFTDTGFDGFPTGTNAVWQHNHPEFNNRIWRNAGEFNKPLLIDNDKNGLMDDVRGWDFQHNDNLPLDENAHGTHTAGLAAAKFDLNADGKRNKIMVLQTHDPLGNASMWQLVQALDYALAHHARVVNMSLAYLAPIGAGGKPTVVEYLMEFAKVHRGTLFVAAAGNDSLDIDQPLALADGTPVRYCPANLPNDNLIVVAAGTCTNALAPFSNFGATSVDLAAPSVDIYSAILSGNYGYFTGTSMATPHVAAAAALAGSHSAEFNWKKIKSDILTKSTASSALSGLTTSGRMLAFCGEYASGGPLLVSVWANQILCLGGSSTLTATPVGGSAPYTFSWSNGGAAAQTTVSAAGTFTVTLTDNTGATATETVKIFGSSAPIADVPADTIFCNETSATLAIQNTVGGANYLWSNGKTTPSITVAPAQTTLYTVTTTLPTGCTSSSQITLPVQRFTANMAAQSLCRGECATLAPTLAGGAAPFQFQWSTGEIAASVQPCPTATKTYRVTVSSDEGCTATASATLTVRAQPKIATIPAQTICPCGSATLTAQVSSGTAPYTYRWMPGNLTGQTVTVSPTAKTTYGLTITDAFGCTATKTVTVSLKCQPPAAEPPVLDLQNQTATFEWQPVCTVNAWQLRWRCGTSGAWATVNIANPAATAHTVAVPAGCSPNWQIRGRCCDNKWSAWSAIATPRPAATERRDLPETDGLKIYPNPATDFLQVEWPTGQPEAQAEIFTLEGKSVRQFLLLSGSAAQPVFVGDLPPGFYFLRLAGGRGQAYFLKN